MTLARFSPLILALSLAACGGGGDGNDAATANEISFSQLTPGTLSTTFMDDGPRPEFTLTASYKGVANSTVFVVINDPDQLFKMALPIVSTDTSTASLKLIFNDNLPAGTYTQPMTLRVCKDQACTQEYRGSPQSVNKNIRIEGLTISTDSLALSSAIGGESAWKDVTVLPSGKSYQATLLNVEHTPPPGGMKRPVDRPFSLRSTATGVQVQGIGAWPGDYIASMTVSAPFYKPKTVKLSYSVTGNTEAFTVLTPSVTASSSRDLVTVDVDALQHVRISQLSAKITGLADPFSWISISKIEDFTRDGVKAKHFRLRFDPCYRGVNFCMARGTYTANLSFGGTEFGRTWNYDVPITFTVP
ncbi:hypothetical protein CDL60_08645 [Roseateles noduli]|nr:hypothetical protein CDL60_08645 [Roseateles noduli]